MRKRLIACLLGAAVLLGAAPSRAQSAAPPDGPVVLTVTGEVGRSNRGPFDETVDRFMATQGTAFDKAMAFDRAALEALGMRKVRAKYSAWPTVHEFEGPLLKDVLAAAGVTGGTAQPVAMDGYAADIPFSDLEKWPVILALKADGRWLAIGGTGPAWVIYPSEEFPELAADDSKWVWAVTHIRIEKGR